MIAPTPGLHFGWIDLEWLLACVYLLGGLNDFFLDLVFYLKPLRHLLAQGRENPRCEEWELHDAREKSIAILIPAWDESAVIGAMLESTSDRLDYANYDIFVGCYPNDEATQMEVARAAFDRPHIHRVVCPNPGPTSKADCLNWVVEAIKLNEQETGKRYEIFVLHDAEDVVHPLALKVHNRFIPEYDLIQLPVIPYERALSKFTGNTYLDEFAENHLKSLTSRLAVGGMVPSAGVGTGFSRAACDQLALQTNHVLFPPVSLTEDYDFSFRLYRNGCKSGLAEVWVDRTDARERHVKELVAIREFFPATFGDAVRQKQRWLLGITFQGAQKLGWGGSLRERYMLLRDRIGVATSFFNLIALLVFFLIAEHIGEALLFKHPWNSTLAQFIPGYALQILIDVNLLLLVNRLVQRGVFVARVARRRQALVAPLRMLWSNVIDFYCAVHAVRRFTYSQYSGKPLKWLKTAHEYPNVETLLRRHRPLGDILLERRLISPDQLRDGLAIQQRPAFRDRYLGEILVESAILSQDQLLDALAVQSFAKASLRTPVETLVDQRESTPLIINQPVLQPAGEAPRRSLFPSQLTPAAAPSGSGARPVATPVATPVVASIPVGIATDPIARASRGVPHLRTHRSGVQSFNFAGAAQRPNRTSIPAQPSAIPPAQLQRISPAGPEIVTEVTRLVAYSPATSSQRRFKMLHALDNQQNPNQKSDSPSAIRPAASLLLHKRFLVVIGTRPEAIKLAPVIAELRARAQAENRPDDVFVCTTGQHREIVLEPLALFHINPDLDLNLMQPGATLAEISARVLEHFSHVLEQVKPEWVVVQGDTATTAMAALAAFYAKVKVAHVEAGLRTHDLQNPFPEEANRRMVGIVAAMHFAATDASRKNLLREGVSETSIRVTGNTGIDALRLHCGRLGLSLDDANVSTPGPVRVLVTAHRRENLESGIESICQAIRTLATLYPDRFHFVWPLHPNPKVSQLAQTALAGLRDVTLTPAVSYDRLLALLAQCDLVLTDSGGLQEEAPSFGKPVLILREATERPEGVWAGVARLVGTDANHIQTALEDAAVTIEAQKIRNLSTDIHPAIPANPYGDGHASTRIADFFLDRPVQEFVHHAAPIPLKRPSTPARHTSGIRPVAAVHAIH
jgi:adsorption protein B